MTTGTALVTGASSGIGAEFARQLAARGHSIVLVARREGRLQALAGELRGQYAVDVEVLVADLSEPADIQRAERRVAELSDLDVLVNAAGFGTGGRFAQIDVDRQLSMIQVHVVAPVRLTRAALPGMLARQRGAIVNVASLAALVSLPGNVTYSATKACLRVFSERLQGELKGTGVRVQALCPGFVYTEFHDSPEYRSFRRSAIPKALWMSPEEVVAASLHALEGEQVVCIPGLRNRLLVALEQLGIVSLLWTMVLARGRRQRPREASRA